MVDINIERKTFVIDIDHTICIAPKVGDVYDYPNAKPIKKVIYTINECHAFGHKIILFTARGMRTFKGDVKKIEEYHRPILENWLKQYAVQYDELIFGKPWGPNVSYVDDKNMTIEQFCGELK